MKSTFFQKVLLCVILGAAAAGLVEWYKMFVVRADEALNPRRSEVNALMK